MNSYLSSKHTNIAPVYVDKKINYIRVRGQLHRTEEAERRRSREGARAICRTKPDWTGRAVTPATDGGMRGERFREEGGVRLELGWLWHCVIV